MAMIRSKGGVVLNKYLVARVFAFDDHESEARAACVAKGWEGVRRGPPLLIVPRTVFKKASERKPEGPLNSHTFPSDSAREEDLRVARGG